MSAFDEDNYEHWPSESKHYAERVAPAPGYDGNNRLQHHSYLVPPKEISSEISHQDSKSPQPPVVSYPQPIYYAQPSSMFAHPGAQQYHSHPVAIYSAPPGYYSHYAPPPATTSAPAPGQAPAPDPQQMAPPNSNHHYYIPAPDEQKKPAISQPNAWLGRTKAQVEEDNMKIAKSEGVWKPKGKMVPTGMEDDQLCWVVELDGSHTLRMFCDIVELTGEWKEDPRYKKSYFFVREEDEAV